MLLLLLGKRDQQVRFVQAHQHKPQFRSRSPLQGLLWRSGRSLLLGVDISRGSDQEPRSSRWRRRSFRGRLQHLPFIWPLRVLSRPHALRTESLPKSGSDFRGVRDLKGLLLQENDRLRRDEVTSGDGRHTDHQKSLRSIREKKGREAFEQQRKERESSYLIVTTQPGKKAKGCWEGRGRGGCFPEQHTSRTCRKLPHATTSASSRSIWCAWPGLKKG